MPKKRLNGYSCFAFVVALCLVLTSLFPRRLFTPGVLGVVELWPPGPIAIPMQLDGAPLTPEESPARGPLSPDSWTLLI